MSMVFPGMTHCRKCWTKLDGEIGLCESCRQADERERKSEGKYKLIDILNKIANGELKEGTKVKYLGDTYLYYRDTLVRGEDHHLLEDIYLNEIREECELIEPQEPTECEHEWENYTRRRIGEGTIRRFRRCVKCGLEEDIEPNDNTTEKIEEINIKFELTTDKLNEVIRKINKEE